MDYYCSYRILFSLLFFELFVSVSCSRSLVQTQQIKDSVKNNSLTALFVFGDSTVDSGNNNYVSTMFKADFWPYGIDLPNHIPTGRFTDGKLTTDFVASHLGIKDYVPPYLDKTLSVEELMTGVSFASAGSGYDPLTAQTTRVINMDKQLEYFKEYKTRIEQVIGKAKMETHIRNAAFIVSAGTNDFVFTYFTLPVRRKQYNITDYQNYLLQGTRNFVQSLIDLGARKIGVVGIPPMGCLPVMITLKSENAIFQRGCIDYYTTVAKEYNQKLQTVLQTVMKNNAAKHGAKVIYVDIHEALLNIIHNYTNLGFVEWKRGCCGSVQQAQTKTNSRHSTTAIFVFGDSTVDPGNNNYITTALKSNFPPYGINLPNHTPTGRFSNGKLPTDFIASHLGLKDYVPPYLNKSLSIEELMTGVSFASAGSGYDPLTPPINNAIPLQKQLEYFKEFKTRLVSAMGTEKTESHFRNAVFFISCGTNDLAENYFIAPIRRYQYNSTDYQNLLLQNARTFFQSLLDVGARKIGIVGIPPIGCLPVIVTLNSKNAILQRGCIDEYSIVAKQFNQKLEAEVKTMQNNLLHSGIKIVYSDIYEPLLDIIHNYKHFGFDEWRRGCCGSGLLELGYLCNRHIPICPDPSKFIFWDSIHPTEKVYYLLFISFLDLIDKYL
ncbi:GDSL esterase/lipase [Thalictrum thalictroides]|uniref:GDSL esterase/lipase n=1 Tax=Thalictrum thalictroides TaxID=46969 RepID=A0A7J6XAY6_THATH|nr:GDSL esterase/lipase [Thalictrum thalictroides]